MFNFKGNIKLDDSNVFSILSSAFFLQLSPVIEICIEYLKSIMTVLNVISIYRFCDEQSIMDLKSDSFDFILENFQIIVQDDDLLNEFNANELSDIFKSLYLNVPNEEIVFEALMKWILMNQQRIKHIYDLVSIVKLPLLKPSFLTKQIETNQLMMNNLSFQMLILEAVTYHLNLDKIKTDPIDRTSPRKSFVSLI